MEGTFSYQASARPVQDRPKYRETLAPTQQLCNIAHDPRIYKGSTYERRNILTEKIEPIPTYGRKTQARDFEVKQDGPPDGFRYNGAQTDAFDENSIIVVKQESEIAVQTDPYNDPKIIHRKPPPITAVSVKTKTQGTDLFDFNEQVKPFVTTLVQKALHDASMEFHEEQELANMARYLRAFNQAEAKEAEKVANIEKIEAEKFAEKERIVQEKLKIEEAQFIARAKILARGYAEFFTWDLADDVVKQLNANNYFYDEVEREIDQQIMPWLFQRAAEEVAKPSIPAALAEAAGNKANEILQAETEKVDHEISEEDEQSKSDRLQILRRMIGERRVAMAMRIKKQKSQKKNKNSEENEEEDEKDE